MEGEPACETRGCLSSCDEINDRCFDEMVPQAYLCDEIHCAIASCDNRGRCSYESRPEYACRTAEMQPCQSTYQCREGLACFGGEFFNDGNNRCVEPCTGNEDCELGIRGARPASAVAPSITASTTCAAAASVEPCSLRATGPVRTRGRVIRCQTGQGVTSVSATRADRAEGESCSGGVYPWPKAWGDSRSLPGRAVVSQRSMSAALQPVATWRFAQLPSADALRRHPRG